MVLKSILLVELAIYTYLINHINNLIETYKENSLIKNFKIQRRATFLILTQLLRFLKLILNMPKEMSFF